MIRRVLARHARTADRPCPAAATSEPLAACRCGASGRGGPINQSMQSPAARSGFSKGRIRYVVRTASPRIRTQLLSRTQERAERNGRFQVGPRKPAPSPPPFAISLTCIPQFKIFMPAPGHILCEKRRGHRQGARAPPTVSARVASSDSLGTSPDADPDCFLRWLEAGTHNI